MLFVAGSETIDRMRKIQIVNFGVKMPLQDVSGGISAYFFLFLSQEFA